MSVEYKTQIELQQQLEEVIFKLHQKYALDFEEIMECKRFLEQVDINVRPNLGYGAEVWARLVKDEDFL